MEIVRVWRGDPTNGGTFNGTAFFIDGFRLVTAKHVVEGIDDIFVNELPNGEILPISKDNIILYKQDIAVINLKKSYKIDKKLFKQDLEIGLDIKIHGFFDEKSERNEFSHKISGYLNEHHTFSLQNFISKGISGAPVLHEGKICGVAQARNKDKNITYIIPISELCIELEVIESIDIVHTLFKNLNKVNAIPQMIITSATTNRLKYINTIKTKAKKSYKDTYHIALPIEDLKIDEYFEEIADVFRIRETIPNRIRRELIRLIDSKDEVFILITDFENDKHLDAFAKFMRSILDKVGDKLRVVTIGGEKLANLKTNKGINSYFNYFEQMRVDGDKELI